MTHADQLTDEWLRGNGINPKSFATTKIKQLQAQAAASNLLKHHGNLLAANQTTKLRKFLRAMESKNTRSKITNGQCYGVLNMAKQINRQVFKAYKQAH